MTPAMTAYIDANQPVTALQVSQALGITRPAFYDHHKRARAVHIVGWLYQASGHPSALYALGAGRDAPRPASLAQQQRSKAYYQRHRAVIRARRPSKTFTRLGIWSGLIGASA